MRGGGEMARVEQNCRRADIPEMEHGPRHGWVGRGASLPVAQAFKPEGFPGGGMVATRMEGLTPEGVSFRTPGCKIVGAPTILFLESRFECKRAIVRRDFSASQMKAHAGRVELRRPQNPNNVGAPTFSFWQRRFWSAGACSRFFGVDIGGQTIEWEVALSSQRRRPFEAQDEQAAALQNCRRADNSKNWKFVFEVVG